MAPAVAGAAMLVPDSTSVPGRRALAAATFTPGAEISGLGRPSRVGPAPEPKWSGRPASCALYAPTTIVSRPAASEMMGWLFSAGERGERGCGGSGGLYPGAE